MQPTHAAILPLSSSWLPAVARNVSRLSGRARYGYEQLWKKGKNILCYRQALRTMRRARHEECRQRRLTAHPPDLAPAPLPCARRRPARRPLRLGALLAIPAVQVTLSLVERVITLRQARWFASNAKPSRRLKRAFFRSLRADPATGKPDERLMARRLLRLPLRELYQQHPEYHGWRSAAA